jgi:two-component system LytT family response regulator
MLARVLIADDEPLARERVRDRVHAIAPAADVREAGDGDAALETIRSWSPDAVFLDIQMPGRDGFGVLGAIGTDQMPPTVFVTAYDAFALRAFDVAAVDYLLKPFDDERFAEAWKRLERAHQRGALAGEAQRLAALLAAVAAPAPGAAHVERFLVRIGERTVLVPVQEVRWLQSDGNYVDLHTPNGTHTIRETLTSVESRLDPAKFIRIHRRVIVAIDFIKEMRPWFAGDQILVLRDGTKLRVTRTRREAVSARLGGAS